MIAAFQMYDWPEVHARTDAFWSGVVGELARVGIDAPGALSRPGDISQPWPDPDLVLGQTCGLPYVSGRCGGAVLVARPDYDVPGASGGTYSSAIVARLDNADTLAGYVGRRAAVNDLGSQSGCNALADAFLQAGLIQDAPLFAGVEYSGSHRASATLVAGGMADIAAIDAVSWALFREIEPAAAAELQVIAWTRAMPSLPFITAARFDAQAGALRDALNAAAKSGPKHPELPIGILPAGDQDYAPIREMAGALRNVKIAPNVHL